MARCCTPEECTIIESGVFGMNALNCFHTYRYNNCRRGCSCDKCQSLSSPELPADEELEEEDVLDFDGTNNKDVCDYIKCIIISQARKCRCEARLFCNASQRLSSELRRARNLCEVNCVINDVSSLFTASAMKDFGTAEVLKGYAMACGDKHKCCCCYK